LQVGRLHCWLRALPGTRTTKTKRLTRCVSLRTVHDFLFMLSWVHEWELTSRSNYHH
jgi:hypothetical protein